jgi:hypothetical protein
MKLTKLTPSAAWISRASHDSSGRIKDYTRVQLNTAADVNNLMVDDNVFVKGDTIDDSIANALLNKVEQLQCKLIHCKPTQNPSVTRFWVAPPITK